MFISALSQIMRPRSSTNRARERLSFAEAQKMVEAEMAVEELQERERLQVDSVVGEKNAIGDDEEEDAEEDHNVEEEDAYEDDFEDDADEIETEIETALSDSAAAEAVSSTAATVS